MNDAKYVYKEVSGDDLEKTTTLGWEYVSAGGYMTPFGPRSTYLVRRPFEAPEAMKLSAEVAALKVEPEKSQQARESLAGRLVRAKNAVASHAIAAAKTGRDKPTRDDLVSMAYRLERDLV